MAEGVQDVAVGVMWLGPCRRMPVCCFEGVLQHAFTLRSPADSLPHFSPPGDGFGIFLTNICKKPIIKVISF